MKAIPFVKMQGAGNDFVVIEGHKSQVTSHKLIQKLCDRKYGIGADGVLLIGKSEKADARMRIFNADGSEAEMCGNGARCAALFIAVKAGKAVKGVKLSLETKAGIIEAQVRDNCPKIKLTDPQDLRLDLHVTAHGKDYEVDFINTGVPHAVITADDLKNISVKDIGKAIRHHEVFKPAGTNVDFVKIVKRGSIIIRTYERGVEDETLACGTGSVAAAIISTLNTGGESIDRPGALHKVFVKTKSGETLTVYFKASKKKITDVWLEGKAKMVFRGEYFI